MCVFNIHPCKDEGDKDKEKYEDGDEENDGGAGENDGDHASSTTVYSKHKTSWPPGGGNAETTRFVYLAETITTDVDMSH